MTTKNQVKKEVVENMQSMAELVEAIQSAMSLRPSKLQALGYSSVQDALDKLRSTLQENAEYLQNWG